LSVSFLPLALAFISLFMSFVFIWVRVTYVRYRYDLLISAAWKSLLPVSLFLLMLALIF
jgi:NADH:ubiquinone oxidoreductase subunit H